MILERELNFVQSEFLDLFHRQIGLLQMYSDEQLRDLSHRCEELKLHDDYSVRVAAEVNFAAAHFAIERRHEPAKTKIAHRD